MLQVRHIELKDANEFVLKLHRHHKPVIGHRFSISCIEDGICRGVAIVGCPVARGCNYRDTLEITRLCTDGTKNACSILYAASARCDKELGYRKIQSYILESETGVSLIASGFVYEYSTAGGQWKGRLKNGKPRRSDQPTEPKKLFSKEFYKE